MPSFHSGDLEIWRDAVEPEGSIGWFAGEEGENMRNRRKRTMGSLAVLCVTVLLAGCGRMVPTKQEQSIPYASATTEDLAQSISLSGESVASPEDDLAQNVEESSESTEGLASDASEETISEAGDPYEITIAFAGDINLDEKWCTTLYMDRQKNGIHDCISSELIDAMRSADICCVNNEFTYSDRGTPLSGKAYTFRAKPERITILEQLGVDVVTLANNHVYDYGRDALEDTFDTLATKEISYFGAGRNLSEAMAPVIVNVDGRTVAFVGASRAEKRKMTPQATEDTPGILRCYDPELFLTAISQAKEQADFCIAVVHWGTEYSDRLEQVQTETGRTYIDAGADAVIGAHSHCLQGMEIYQGKPIIYSLGNFWFNEKTLDTMLLQLQFSGNETESSVGVQVLPALQKGYCTRYVEDEDEQRRIFDYLESISENIRILDDGSVVPAGSSKQDACLFRENLIE